MIIKTIIGTKEEYNMVEIIGITDERQFLYAPAVFLPYETWDSPSGSGKTTTLALLLVY